MQCERIADELNLEQGKVNRIQGATSNTSEQAFCILWDWVAGNTDAKLSKTMSALKSCNMTVKLTTKCNNHFRQVQSRLKKVGDRLDDELIRVVSSIIKVWRFIGRLLGVSLDYIHNYVKLESEAPIDMLQEWVKNCDKEATYKKFVTALIVMHNLETQAGAWDAVRNFLNTLQ